MNNTTTLRLVVAGLVAGLAANAGRAFTYIYADTANTVILRWSTTVTSVPIRILLDNSTAKSDGSTLAASAQGAAQTWNALLGTIQFAPTIAAGSPGDGNHVNELAMAADIYGKAFDSTTLAVTTTWVSGARRSEADIVFNSAKTWDSYPGNTRTGVVDLHRVAIHELGHVLGLDHPDEAGQTVSAIMNSHISSLDTLTMDDINGAQNIYGPPGVPANDNFASATALTLTNNTATLTGFNSNATKETGEPAHASNAGSTGHSVWWKWTAPTGGSITVDTNGSYFDTTMGIYTGTSVAALTKIDDNDDAPSAPGTPHNTWSSISFTAVAGTTYYIAVDGFSNDTGGSAESGGLTLNVTFLPGAGTLATITAQPVSTIVTAGNTASFTTAATAGTSAISYQWQFNGSAIAGATGVTLTLSNVTSANAGSYTVVVTTTAGSVTSNAATLTVNPAPVTPPPAAKSGGGGGGAPSLWFLLTLGAAGLARMFRRRR